VSSNISGVSLIENKPLHAVMPSILLKPNKIALVHYWLVAQRGGEAVLEAIGRLTPNADLFAHVINPQILFGSLSNMRLTRTFIDQFPAAQRHYQAYLPFMPAALEALDMSDYDLIISSEAGPAKWVIPSPGAVHICYCHSPMRYIWDQRRIYFDKLPRIARPFAHMMAHDLRKSDALSSTRVTQFVANSSFVQQRINQYYRRDAVIIHPPIDVDEFSIADPEDFYLCAGEIRDYKRLELAVEACMKLGRRLIIAGAGDTRSLRDYKYSGVTFAGRLARSDLLDLMKRCRALIFPGVEDFGIIPVEVMASGRPVIAYGYGGAMDSVEPGRSGLFFEQQTVDHLVDAILEFERNEGQFSYVNCQLSARRFSRHNFEQKMAGLINSHFN
jgi:glycosyltransferase involved in cell wall biosynthesis